MDELKHGKGSRSLATYLEGEPFNNEGSKPSPGQDHLCHLVDPGDDSGAWYPDLVIPTRDIGKYVRHRAESIRGGESGDDRGKERGIPA